MGEMTRISAPAPKAKPKPSEPVDDTKWLALTIRRGLLVIVRGIEQKYGIEDKDQKAA